MTRAFLIVIDSVGIGGAPDADAYFNGDVPDTGANTLGHIAAACAVGKGDGHGRSGALHLPVLSRLGIGKALKAASGFEAQSLDPEGETTGLWGYATEQSRGKDTPSGHWELAGVPVPWLWHVFPEEVPTFPQSLIDELCTLGSLNGILGNCHASGTEIIARLGGEHMRTGLPICYTSADSVFQIAAHEESFGLKRLHDLCRAIAPRLHEMRVGRVIARPFVGNETDGFERTGNRRDFALDPPAPVLTNWVQDAGHHVYGVGKIGDIFSMQGIDTLLKGNDAQLMAHLLELTETAVPGSLTFANLVEFDSLYGHRRNVAGYARHLEWFDAQLGEMLSRLKKNDLLVITADHGNDPTWIGTDHTRERVPVLVAGRNPGPIGSIAFADVGASIAAHLNVSAPQPGRAMF